MTTHHSISIHMCMYVCVCTYIYIHTHTYISIYIYVYTSIYIYTPMMTHHGRLKDIREEHIFTRQHPWRTYLHTTTGTLSTCDVWHICKCGVGHICKCGVWHICRCAWWNSMHDVWIIQLMITYIGFTYIPHQFDYLFGVWKMHVRTNDSPTTQFSFIRVRDTFVRMCDTFVCVCDTFARVRDTCIYISI